MVDKRSQQASGYRQRPNRNKVKSVAMTRICSNIKKWMFVFALWEFGVNAHSSVNAFVCASTYCQHTQFSDRAGEGPNATPARKHELDKRVGREGSGGGGLDNSTTELQHPPARTVVLEGSQQAP